MAPTTRRYPRTLAEAFPKEYACAIEAPPRESAGSLARACFYFAAFVLFVLVGFHAVARYFGG